MYGFHKVNKLPRGTKPTSTSATLPASPEARLQFEFSHPKFLRDCPDLSEHIKRKSLENEIIRRETCDLSAQLQLMHVSQQEMMHQLREMQSVVMELVQEFQDCKRCQGVDRQIIRGLCSYVQRHGNRKLFYWCPTRIDLLASGKDLSIIYEAPTLILNFAYTAIPSELDFNYLERQAHGTKGAANPDIYIHPPPELESQPPSTSYSSMHMNGFNHPSFNHDKSIAENTSPTCSTNLPPVSFYTPHSPDTA